MIFQVWDFVNQVYDMAMYFVVDDGATTVASKVVTDTFVNKVESVYTDIRRWSG